MRMKININSKLAKGFEKLTPQARAEMQERVAGLGEALKAASVAAAAIASLPSPFQAFVNAAIKEARLKGRYEFYKEIADVHNTGDFKGYSESSIPGNDHLHSGESD